MKEVIYIGGQTKIKKMPVKFTHYLSGRGGWQETDTPPTGHDKIVFIGHCDEEGEIFAAYCDNYIFIYKGHLNSGKY